MPVHAFNRTITQIAVTQGAAGNTDLVAAPGAAMRIFVVGFVLVLDAGGSVKFTEGTGPTNLTGVMPLLTSQAFAIFGDGETPVLQTNTANSKLSITTVTGKAFGWLSYFIDAA